MRFYYKSGDKKGRIIEDYLDAKDIKSAQKIIEDRGEMIFQIKKESFNFNFFEKLKGKKEVLPFTKMFYVLLRSGMEVVNILEVMLAQIESQDFKKAIHSILINVRSGDTLSGSMKKHKDFFSDFYCAAISAGEETGSLEKTFFRLYNYNSTMTKIKNKMRLALIYPVFLLIFAVLVVFFLSIYVLPSFSKIYISFGKNLPFITRVILTWANFAKDFWYLIVLGVLIMIYIIQKSWANIKIREKIHRILIYPKRIREFIYLRESISIFRTLNLALESGMDIIRALKMSRDTVTNLKIKKDMENVIDLVTQGKKISYGFSEIDFPKLAIQMVNAGEESNNLEEMLGSISEMYEDELENTILRLMGFVEPILIIVVGGAIGAVIIAMILPILNLATVIT